MIGWRPSMPDRGRRGPPAPAWLIRLILSVIVVAGLLTAVLVTSVLRGLSGP